MSLEVDWSTGERMVTTHGDRPAAVRTLPITYRGAEVGRLVLPAKGVRSRLSTRDEQLLGDLVRQAATAVRTSQLAEEVQQSRERLVTAREEERRRIRRDLHDGLGPSLSGTVFQLEAARMAVDTDPEAAKRQLAGISEHVQTVVADVRRLVHDLRPPALDDRGLVGAIRQQADRLEIPLSVTAPDLDGQLPAAVEVAAYRIAGEALTNVSRHARASAATLTLDLSDDALVIELADDGVGIDPDLSGRCRPGQPPRTGRRARRPRRHHLSGRRRHRRQRPTATEEHRMTAPSSPIRVVVVDDHQIVRDGLTALLGALDGIEVVGSAADGREALHVVGEAEPDVVVMDIQMPQLDGIEATRFLVGRNPGLRILMLTMNEDDDTILSAIRAGACGYLLKGSGAEEVHNAIRTAAGWRDGLRGVDGPAGGGAAGEWHRPRGRGRAVPRPHRT